MLCCNSNKSKLPPPNDSLTGILKGSKPPQFSDPGATNERPKIMLGFTAVNLLLDGADTDVNTNMNNTNENGPATANMQQTELNNIDLSTQVDIPERYLSIASNFSIIDIFHEIYL